MDYEATRAEYEAYAARWNAERPATGLIYWMLNNAWPSLHWNQIDYYNHPAGSYFGTKVGSRIEHVAYNYNNNHVYLINQGLAGAGERTVEMELMDTKGNLLAKDTVKTQTQPNTSRKLAAVPGLGKIQDVAFLRLVLTGADGAVLSRNVYWLATSLDELEWGRSTWFFTPVKTFADYTALNDLQPASLVVTAVRSSSSSNSALVTLDNQSDVPAFFVRLNLVDTDGEDIVPVLWSDNYVTLWPNEKLVLEASWSVGSDANVEISGGNVGSKRTVAVV